MTEPMTPERPAEIRALCSEPTCQDEDHMVVRGLLAEVDWLNERVTELEGAIDRVMKMPMHPHDNHWCSSSCDVLRALGDAAPAPTGEAIAGLLSGLAERDVAPTEESGR